MTSIPAHAPAKRKILCVVGTRPEGIKMAPVIRALVAAPWAEVRILATAQHRQLLDQVLGLFGITPDRDLDIMEDGQSLAGLTSRLLARVDEVLAEEKPDIVVAQGDTTTVFTMALCCYYRNIPFAHVEAGLRTFDRHSPFPEEMNRVVASYLADLHFAPTERAKANLLNEGVAPERIFVTGNTVIDALHYQAKRVDELDAYVDPAKRLILVTAHRRENFGAPLASICAAIAELAERYEDLHFLIPVHPNPNVAGTINSILGGLPRISLCEPLDYAQFVAALKRCYLVLTDSGGVQEEAPALGKPVLVMRTDTERPEAVEVGVARLVGTDRIVIFDEVSKLLTDNENYALMARGGSPYGDGYAAQRIVTAIANFIT